MKLLSTGSTLIKPRFVNGNTPMTLKYDNLETAEAHFDAIAMFLENQQSTIMAMAPTQEEEL